MRYNPKEIEGKWQKKWAKDKTYEPDLKGKSASGRRPFYNLMMFPYPSAEGLHVGNMYAFAGSDIYGRFQRMQGLDVFEPIGLDGFGIHSENYALKIGKHPMKQSKVSEKNFYRQLSEIGNGFAWNEHLETYDPDYYKWTQWIFVQMFKKGLAYRKKAKVNWCPSCKTVLADEQVIQGKCERCSSEVIKKDLEQWFFRITNYAEQLLKNLEKIDWSPRVKIAQAAWIGKSEGAELGFRIKDSEFSAKVFTTRPDTLFGATYMVLAPEHELVKSLKLKVKNWGEVEKYIKTAAKKTEIERTAETKDKTGVELKGVKAINPATKEEIPIWVADYVLAGYGTGAIMAVPAHDQRDYAFAVKFDLPTRVVIEPLDNSIQNAKIKNQNDNAKFKIEKAYEDEGVLTNSGRFSGMSSDKAKWEIAQAVGGERKTQYRLRDWLISRQRYWGPPIPMIFCEKCGWQPVPEKDLPVKLPFVKDFRPTGTGQSPLASVKSFYETKCPKCKSKARRETDVSDTFLDSAWYFIGYLMTFGNWKLKIGNSAFSRLARKWLPVDMYIGGAEHSVLHLLYSRFLTMVLHDWGLLNFEEPYKKFRAHGLIIKDGSKMSKSKGNIVNPDDYIKAYGADALRLYLMFTGPFQNGGDFRDAGIAGMTRFLQRIWRLFGEKSKVKSQKSKLQSKSQKFTSEGVQQAIHQTIKKVTKDIEALHYNTAISALMILLNEFESKPEAVTPEAKKNFLQLLAPFAPHIAEELWSFLGGKFSIHCSSWPTYDPKKIESDEIDLVVQINGRVRGRLRASRGIKEAEAVALAQKDVAIAKYLAGAPKKIIFVPGRLINFVF